MDKPLALDIGQTVQQINPLLAWFSLQPGSKCRDAAQRLRCMQHILDNLRLLIDIRGDFLPGTPFFPYSLTEYGAFQQSQKGRSLKHLGSLDRIKEKAFLETRQLFTFIFHCALNFEWDPVSTRPANPKSSSSTESNTSLAKHFDAILDIRYRVTRKKRDHERLRTSLDFQDETTGLRKVWEALWSEGGALTSDHQPTRMPIEEILISPSKYWNNTRINAKNFSIHHPIDFGRPDWSFSRRRSSIGHKDTVAHIVLRPSGANREEFALQEWNPSTEKHRTIIWTGRSKSSGLRVELEHTVSRGSFPHLKHKKHEQPLSVFFSGRYNIMVRPTGLHLRGTDIIEYQFTNQSSFDLFLRDAHGMAVKKIFDPRNISTPKPGAQDMSFLERVYIFKDTEKHILSFRDNKFEDVENREYPLLWFHGTPSRESPTDVKVSFLVEEKKSKSAELPVSLPTSPSSISKSRWKLKIRLKPKGSTQSSPNPQDTPEDTPLSAKDIYIPKEKFKQLQSFRGFIFSFAEPEEADEFAVLFEACHEEDLSTDLLKHLTDLPEPAQSMRGDSLLTANVTARPSSETLGNSTCSSEEHQVIRGTGLLPRDGPSVPIGTGSPFDQFRRG